MLAEGGTCPTLQHSQANLTPFPAPLQSKLNQYSWVASEDHMSKNTDPARELVTICEKLQNATNKRGDAFVARQMTVNPWSIEFFSILFCISERVEFLATIIGELDLDDDYKEQAIQHVRSIQSAFDGDSMSTSWNGTGAMRLGVNHVQPLKMLSPLVRQKVCYPELSPEERDELLELVRELRGWLEMQQLPEQDFIRQAIIEGLKQLIFRLERLEWVGWGYTLDSLREVISAYFALSHGLPEQDVAPVAHAMLKKLTVFVKAFYEKANLTKGVYETGDFMLKAYGAIALLGHQPTNIAGLLTSG